MVETAPVMVPLMTTMRKAMHTPMRVMVVKVMSAVMPQNSAVVRLVAMAL